MRQVKAVDSYPAYTVDTDGVVTSYHSGKPLVLKQARVSSGYLAVGLFSSEKRQQRTVHSLVAHAFLGPRPKGYVINHKNGNKQDNSLANLEYVTAAQNSEHAKSLGLYASGERNHFAKLTEQEVLRIRSAEFADLKQGQIAKLFGIHQTTVSLIRSSRTWVPKESK